MKLIRFAIIFFTLFIGMQTANALVLKDFYKLSKVEIAWYLVGVYDTLLIHTTDNSARTDCLNKKGGIWFTHKMSEFVQALPVDENAPERKAFDTMPMAGIAFLIVEKECSKK